MDSSVNSAGILEHLEEANFKERTRDQPWLIMFHAPWYFRIYIGIFKLI